VAITQQNNPDAQGGPSRPCQRTYAYVSPLGHANTSVSPLSSPPFHLNLTLPSLQSGKTRVKVPRKRTFSVSAVASGSSRVASSSLLRLS
jgi:hypothetical protein